MPKQHKYKTTFSCKLNPLVSEDTDKYLSLASKKNLAQFIPKNIDFNQKPDFLGFSGEAFFGNRLNRNGDGVKAEEAILLAKSVPFSFVDLNHKRNECFGVLVNASFVEFGTDKILTEEEVRKTKSPFTIVVGGVLWKPVNPKLVQAIEASNNPSSEYKDTFFISWELMFNSMELVVMASDKYNFEDGKIITDPEEITKIEAKYNITDIYGDVGGNVKVGRVAVGDVIFAGIGIVENPAAYPIDAITVKSETQSNSAQNILSSTFIKQLKDAPESGAGYHKCDVEMEDGSIAKDIIISNCSDLPENMDGSKVKKITIKAVQNQSNSTENEESQDKEECNKECEEKLARIQECLRNINKTLNLSDKDLECVAELLLEKENKQDLVNTLIEIAAQKENIISQNTKTNVIKTMNINKVEDITQENLKEITASQIQDFIVKKCAEISENWVNEKKTKENELKSLAESKKTLDETVTSLNTKLAEVNKSLETIKAEAAEKAKIETYNQRMAHIESIYELDPEITKIVASDLKDIDEDGFKKVEEKYKVLFKDKNRAEIEAAKKKAAKTPPADDPEDKKDKGADEDTEDKNGKKLPPWLKKKAKASVEDAVDNSEKEKANIPNSTSTETPTLAERAKKAFAKENITIDCSRRRKI